MLHRKCQFVKLWERSVRLNQIQRRLWDIVREMDAKGLGSHKVAIHARHTIVLAKSVKARLDAEVNCI